MRLDPARALLLTAGLALAAALAFVWASITANVSGAATHPGLAILLGAGLGGLVALLAASLVSARARARAAAITAVAQRYALGDLSRPGTDYGDDDLGTTARAFDAAVQVLGRRMTDLARDRARSEAILSSMVEGVLVVDDAGRLQLANGAARRMLHFGVEAVGRPYVEAVRHPAVAEQLRRVLAGQPSAVVELSLTRTEGRDLIARLAPVAEAGRGAVMVLHDITDLKRADQVRRDFVANVSHELRTPLTAIRGYAEALLDGGDDPELRTRFLGIIERHAARMERLVTELLRLARLDAGQEPLEPAVTNVATLLTGVKEDLGAAIAEKGHQVTVRAGADVAAVRVDPAKVHDIVRNLVENAVNYTPADGVIEVSAAVDGETLVLDVVDNGPGIPSDDLGRVFERFYRVDKSRGRPGGTGLGLAIVRHLAELHRGSVAVRNRPGGGAAFEVRLAMLPPDLAPPPAFDADDVRG